MQDHIGIELKVRRVRAGIRQYRLAQMLGIPPSVLSSYENGIKPIPPEQAERIAGAIDRLVGESSRVEFDAIPA